MKLAIRTFIKADVFRGFMQQFPEIDSQSALADTIPPSLQKGLSQKLISTVSDISFNCSIF